MVAVLLLALGYVTYAVAIGAVVVLGEWLAGVYVAEDRLGRAVRIGALWPRTLYRIGREPL